jgi:hypothetical protein
MSDTTFSAAEERVSVGVLFTKVDKEKRTVSGFATLDNIDAHGDIVDADASLDAFRRFRGGLREMHTNNAVGTLVDFEEAKKFHEEDNKIYRGVYITAKVSKGAEDTWEKVLDGTYKGFSIGGKIKKRSVMKSDSGTEHMVIKEYDLIEVSLVDNPANPLANLLTVRKIGDTFVYTDLEKAEPGALAVGDFVSWNSSGGQARGRITRIVKDSTVDVPDSSVSVTGTPEDPAALIRVYRDGEATDTLVGHKFSTLTKIDSLEKSQYNILYHAETGDVVLSEHEERDGFINIGWAEENDTEAIRRAVDNYKTSNKEGSEGDEITLVLHKNDVIEALAKSIKLSKEVLSMATDNVEETVAEEAAVEETAEEAVAEADVAVEETVEKSADEAVEEEAVEEVSEEEEAEVAEGEEVEKSADGLDSIVSKVQEVVVDAVSKAVDAAKESKDAVETVKASFEETLENLKKELSGIKENLDTLNGRVEAVESDTAVKKSSDILKDEEDDDEEGDFWRGSGFLSAGDLIRG